MSTPTDDRYATPGQLKYIARLSARAGEPEPSVRSYGEAGRMIRALEAEIAFQRRVKSDALTRACYNTLAAHGEALHYDIITSTIQSRNPSTRLTKARVLACLNWRKDLFRKVDTGVYFLASKSEGRSYPEL